MSAHPTINGAYETLNGALRRLGYTTKPGAFRWQRIIMRDGVELTSGRAHENWEWFLRSGIEVTFDTTPEGDAVEVLTKFAQRLAGP